MKELVLSGLLLMGLSSLGFGQTDDPGCNVGVSVTDYGCTTGQDDYNFVPGCTSSSEFRVVCNGTIWVRAWTSCASGSCNNCAVCVWTAPQMLETLST